MAVLYLLEDILQGGWKLYPVLYRETQSMRLSRLMVRVLSDNHHFYFVEGTEVKSVEYQLYMADSRSYCHTPVAPNLSAD